MIQLQNNTAEGTRTLVQMQYRLADKQYNVIDDQHRVIKQQHAVSKEQNTVAKEQHATAKHAKATETVMLVSDYVPLSYLQLTPLTQVNG